MDNMEGQGGSILAFHSAEDFRQCRNPGFLSCPVDTGSELSILLRHSQEREIDDIPIGFANEDATDLTTKYDSQSTP